MKKQLVLLLAGLVISFCYVTAQNEHGNPFRDLGYKGNVYTLTDFEEFHDFEDVVEIGQVFYDTKQKKVVGFVGEKDHRIELKKEIISTSIDPHCEKYPWISPYAYCMNNPVNLVDPDGRDWYRFHDVDGNWQYGWDSNIQLANDIDKNLKNVEYLGKTYSNDENYFSLLGSTYDASDINTKIIGKMDEALINHFSTSQKLSQGLDVVEPMTNYDVGLYKAGDNIMHAFGYEGGDVYYYRIGEGVGNKGKFGGFGRIGEGPRSNSNRNTGFMKDGYPVTFERNAGGSDVRGKAVSQHTEPAIKIVFPTSAAKEVFYQNVRSAMYGNRR